MWAQSLPPARGIPWLAWTVTLAAGLLLVVPSATASRVYRLDASGELQRRSGQASGITVLAGTIRGAPFRSGEMVLRSDLVRGYVNSTFTVRMRNGTVAGRSRARLTLDGDTANYAGTATITSGTGRYRRARATGLRFTGRGPINARSTRLRMTGRVRY